MEFYRKIARGGVHEWEEKMKISQVFGSKNTRRQAICELFVVAQQQIIPNIMLPLHQNASLWVKKTNTYTHTKRERETAGEKNWMVIHDVLNCCAVPGDLQSPGPKFENFRWKFMICKIPKKSGTNPEISVECQ